MEHPRMDDIHMTVPPHYQYKVLLNEPWTPHPRRRWDSNIMEDTHRLLPHNTLMAINNIRLYLHVTHLSEITDTSGLFI